MRRISDWRKVRRAVRQLQSLARQAMRKGDKRTAAYYFVAIGVLRTPKRYYAKEA